MTINEPTIKEKYIVYSKPDIKKVAQANLATALTWLSPYQSLRQRTEKPLFLVSNDWNFFTVQYTSSEFDFK